MGKINSYAENHRSLVNIVANMKPVEYQALLAAKNIEQLEAMFALVDQTVYSLQNLEAVNNDERVKNSTYNSLRDERNRDYDKFINNAYALSDINDPAALKTLQVGIAFENKDMVKQTAEWIALNPRDYISASSVEEEYARAMQTSVENVKCYFMAEQLRKELAERKTYSK